jgi:hypothetical protein
MNTTPFIRLSAVAAFGCLAFAATGCVVGAEEDEHVGRQEDGIVNGTVFDVAPYLVFTKEEKAAPDTQANIALRERFKAVGVLGDSAAPAQWWGIGYCTATLVGPRTVLTAAHCLKGKTTVHFQIDGKQSVKAKKVLPHPSWNPGQNVPNDIGLLILESSVTDVDPEPIQVKSVNEGDAISVIGYGDYNFKKPDGSNGYKGNGTKRIGLNLIDEGLFAPEPGFFRYSELKGGGTAHGDSGGPVFVADPSGSDVIAGVTAASDEETATSTKVSYYAKWLYDTSKGDIRFVDPIPPKASHQREIRTKNSGLCLTKVKVGNTNSIRLKACSGSAAQSWNMSTRENGTYGLAQSGQCLTGGQPDSCSSGNATVDPANEVRIGQCSSNNVPASCERYEVKTQDWILLKHSNGKFTIRSLNGLQCLSAVETANFKGTALNACSGGDAQQWDLK